MSRQRFFPGDVVTVAWPGCPLRDGPDMSFAGVEVSGEGVGLVVAVVDDVYVGMVYVGRFGWAFHSYLDVL